MSNQEFVITHTFNAPREFVWKAWTVPAMLAQWFGPKGTKCDVIKHELRPGGVFHSRLPSPDGTVMWGKFVYREVDAPNTLVWIHSFSDAGGINLTRHPLNAHWPLELLTTVRFEDQGKQTKLTLTWVPINATEEERKTFEAAIPGMNQGWGGSFEQLDEYLSAAAKAA